jgi:hypothetical protein
MKNKKQRYDKTEVEKIMGIAFNIKEHKGETHNKEELDKMNSSGLSTKNILKQAEKFKTEKQKESTEKPTLKKKKEKRQRKKSTLYALYFIIWGLIISALIIPFFIADIGSIPFIHDDDATEEDSSKDTEDIENDEDSTQKEDKGNSFGMLWLVVMIGMSIVGLITGMFIAELEGILWGFFIGAGVGLIFYFILRYWALGRIISAIILTLLSVLLFFVVFKPRFAKMVKGK